MSILKFNLRIAILLVVLLCAQILYSEGNVKIVHPDTITSIMDRTIESYRAHEYQEIIDELGPLLSQVEGQDSIQMDIHYEMMLSYGHLAQYDKQFEHILSGLGKAQKLDNHFMLLSFYRELGSFHDEPLNDPKSGLVYMKMAIPYIDAVKPNSQCGLMMDIGLTCLSAGELDSAQYYYERAFEYLEKAESMKNDVYSFYTPYLLKTGKLEEARYYAEYTFDAWHKSGFLQGYTYSAIELAEINFREKRYQDALHFAQVGHSISDQLNNLELKTESLEWKAKSQEALGMTQEGLTSYRELNILKDSIDVQERFQQLNQKKFEYLTTEYKDELEAIIKDNQKLSSNVSFSKKALLCLCGAIILLGLFYFKNIKSKEKMISQLTEVLSLSEEELSNLKNEYQEAVNELDKNKRELTSSALFLEKKDEALKSVRKILSKIDIDNNIAASEEIKSARKLADTSINIDNNWESFRYFFEQIYPSFYREIKKDHDLLNRNELRYLSYIKIGLTDKESARLLGINTASFQKSKYRLKKKLQLPKELSVTSMLEKY